MPKTVITIGAAHGGIDLGAVGPAGLREKNCSLTAARRIAGLFDPGVFDARLIRDGDFYLSPEARGKKAAALNSACHTEAHFSCCEGKDSFAQVFAVLSRDGDLKYAEQISEAVSKALNIKNMGVIIRGRPAQAEAAQAAQALADCGVPRVFIAQCGNLLDPLTEFKLRQQNTIFSIAAGISGTISIMLSESAQAGDASAPADTLRSKASREKLREGVYFVRDKPSFDGRAIGIVTGGLEFETYIASGNFRMIYFRGKAGFVEPGAFYD